MDLDRLTALGQNNSNLLKLKSVDSSLEIRWRNSTCAVEALPSQILVSNVGTHIRQDFLHTVGGNILLTERNRCVIRSIDVIYGLIITLQMRHPGVYS
jgi:hypothetical protein